MYKRLLVLLFLIAPVFSLAQDNNTVSGTVVDSDSTTWANGTWSAVLGNPQGGSPTYADTGGAVKTQYSGSLNGSGAFSQSGMANNGAILPSGTFWLFTFCPNASFHCTQLTQVTLAGSTYSLTSAATAVAPPRFFSGAGAFGYVDAEATASNPGGVYYNVTTPCARIWSGSAWSCLGAGGGSVSITSTAGTLTLTPSPLTGTGTIDINLANANTWTAVQTFGTNISIGGVTPSGATGTGNIVFGTSATLVTPALGTPASGVITNLTGTCTSCIANTVTNGLTANGTGNQVWGMNSGGSAQGWQTINIGFTNPMTTLGDLIYGGASGAATRLAGPTVGTVAYNLCSSPSGGAAVAPVWCLAGIGGRTVSGTTDTVALTDRGNVISYNSASAVAVTLTSAATLANNFAFGVWNENAGVVTFTPGAGTINGASTLAINEGENCSINSPDNTNYVARCSSGQLVAGTNITFTRGVNGLTIAASGGSLPTGTNAQTLYYNGTTLTATNDVLDSGTGINQQPLVYQENVGPSSFTTITASCGSAATTCAVASSTGYPVPTAQTPMYIAAWQNSSTAVDVWQVTAISGLTWTIAAHAEFGSTATAYTSGATMILLDHIVSDSTSVNPDYVHVWKGYSCFKCTWDAAFIDAGVGYFEVNGGGSATHAVFTGTLVISGLATYGSVATGSVCSSTASPAVCGSAPAGKVQIAAASTSLVIDTSAVTTSSTCNLTYSTVGITAPANMATLLQPYISAISAGVSFTITVGTAPTTNPVNVLYNCVN